jgi:hypothetical protein
MVRRGWVALLARMALQKRMGFLAQVTAWLDRVRGFDLAKAPHS